LKKDQFVLTILPKKSTGDRNEDSNALSTFRKNAWILRKFAYIGLNAVSPRNATFRDLGTIVQT